MRHKDGDWTLPAKLDNWEQVIVAVLMDIRDELKAVNNKLGCYRVPRALDDLHSLGVAARRRRRMRRKK